MVSLEILALGAGVGLVSTFLGLGGGLILVPLLPWALGFTHLEAVATSLFTVFVVVSRNTWAFHLQKRVMWKVALWIGPVTAVAAFFAAYAAPYLPISFLKIFLLGLYTLVLLRSLNLWPEWGTERMQAWIKKKGAFLGVGLAAGTASGLAGVGAGVLLTPYLMFTRLVKPDEVTPTSNAIMSMATFSGVLSFAAHQVQGDLQGSWGYVHWKVGGLIFIGAFLTGILGHRLQHKMSEDTRRKLLIFILVTMILRVAWNLKIHF